MSVPYWQAREFAVLADVGVDTMRAVLAGADASKSRARARAYQWLKDHGRQALVPPQPAPGAVVIPKPERLASQRLKVRWQDPVYRERMKEQARRQSPNGPTAKLTREAVDAARAEYATGKTTVAALAAKHGVCRAAMADAIAGRTWRA